MTDDPEQVIDRMEQLIAETSSKQEKTTPLDEGTDPIARKHRGAIRSGAEEDSNQ